MQIACDESGIVRLTGNGLPAVWNGMALTVTTLTPEQQAAYGALSEDRSGTRFADGVFEAQP